MSYGVESSERTQWRRRIYRRYIARCWSLPSILRLASICLWISVLSQGRSTSIWSFNIVIPKHQKYRWRETSEREQSGVRFQPVSYRRISSTFFALIKPLFLQNSLDGRNSLISLTLILANGTMTFQGSFTAYTKSTGYGRLHFLGGTGDFQSVIRGYFDMTDYQNTILNITAAYHKAKRVTWTRTWLESHYFTQSDSNWDQTIQKISLDSDNQSNVACQGGFPQPILQYVC